MNDICIQYSDFSCNNDLVKLVHLQNEVYPSRRITSINGFRNWYVNNPNGRVISFNAWDKDKMVAHYACIPKKMIINGAIVLGLHSMATVTHPNYRGRGLFKLLASKTYSYAIEQGYKFVIGVANANSYPGFIKHFKFQDVGKLDVMLGINNNIQPEGNKIFSVFWDNELLLWRTSHRDYVKDCHRIYGTIGFWKFKRIFGIKTFLGTFKKGVTKSINIPEYNGFSSPINLYVGMGSNAKKIGYFSLPNFIKRSPFHLIFLDLTDGELPKITKDNIFFQLIDFDVA